MSGKKGYCRIKNCTSQILESGEANKLRLCELHYQKWKGNKEKLFKNNVERIAGKLISKKKMAELDLLMTGGNVKDAILRKKIRRDWLKYKKINKSALTHILKSREWLNTQELINRRYILCTGPDFMKYVQDICRLYTCKLLYSREYLKKENSYKKYISYNVIRFKYLITLKLEVTWIFNQDTNVSVNSRDIVLVPSRIRRMVSLKKSLLKKKIKKTLLQNIIDSNTKDNRMIIARKTGGVYNKIKKENTAREIKDFMLLIKRTITPDSSSLHNFKPFGYTRIENLLPLFNLAQQQFRRVYPVEERFLFLNLKKLWRLPEIYLEIFALLSLYYLASGSGFTFINKLSSWINPEKGIFKVSFDEFFHEFKKMFSVEFNINLEDKRRIAKLYNSCFSDDVINYEEINDDISSIIKNNRSKF